MFYKCFFGDAIKFTDFICFDALIPELKATDRDGAITELVSALADSGSLGGNNKTRVAKAIIKREQEASTGMGKGVALPHIKDKAVKEVIAAIGKSSAGLDFSSLDKEPVYSVILLISPVDNPDKHLQAMENMFKHLQQEKFRKFLMQSQTAEQMEDLLREADDDVFL